MLNERSVLDRCMTEMRCHCRHVPTAVLSRQTAGLRGKSLILNLPGKPKAIRETIDEVNGHANLIIRIIVFLQIAAGNRVAVSAVAGVCLHPCLHTAAGGPLHRDK